MPQYLGCHTVAPEAKTFAPPVGLNCGIAHASRDTDFLLVLNDDLVLSRNSLDALLASWNKNPGLGLLMPIGNDQQSRYALDVHIPPGPYKYEQLAWMAPQLMHMDSKYPPGIMYTDLLCLYAMFTSKKVYEDIGPFDQALVSMDDIDYSLRSRKKGYLNAIELSSLVTHFGGASTQGTWTDEMRQKGLELFNKKWQHQK